jgi:hypothetical protein
MSTLESAGGPSDTPVAVVIVEVTLCFRERVIPTLVLGLDLVQLTVGLLVLGVMDFERVRVTQIPLKLEQLSSLARVLARSLLSPTCHEESERFTASETALALAHPPPRDSRESRYTVTVTLTMARDR